jgi:hypothetical protein
MKFVMLLWVCIHTGQAEKFAGLLWDTSPMLYQLSCEVKSVRVGDISELSLVPSISMYCVLLCTQVNMMFVVLLWVFIHTGQAGMFAWPRWESNPRPLGTWTV